MTIKYLKLFITIICFILICVITSSCKTQTDRFIEDCEKAQIAVKYDDNFMLYLEDKIGYAAPTLTFSENESIPFKKVINYYVSGACYDKEWNIYPEMKQYLDSQELYTFIVPCDIVDRYIKSKFNTTVNRESIETFDPITKTYRLVFSPGESYINVDVLSVTPKDNDRYEVVIMMRPLNDLADNLTIYKKLTVEIKKENYKFISLESIKYKESDYELVLGAYENSRMYTTLPIFVSKYGIREKFLREKSDEILKELIIKINHDSEKRRIEKISLNHTVTYNDFNIISILFEGKVKYFDSDEETNTFYTINTQTVKAGAEWLSVFFDDDNNDFLAVFESNLKSQLPNDKIDYIKDFTYEDYLDKIIRARYEYNLDFKNNLKFNITDKELIVYINFAQQNEEYLKIVIPLNQIKDFMKF